MRKPVFIPGCIALLIAVLPLLAHHGSAGYDIQNPKILIGTLRRVELVNPHSFIYIDVTTSSGTVETWALEGFPPRVLEASSGLTKENLKPGMKLTVIGYPPREAPPSGNGTYRSLDQALSYSAGAVDALKTRHILQVGEIRLETGEVRAFGMGAKFNPQR